MPTLIHTLDRYVSKAIDSKDPSTFKRSLATIQEVLLQSHHHQEDDTIPYTGTRTSTIIEQLGGGADGDGGDVVREGIPLLRCGNQTKTLPLFPAPTTSTLYGCFGRDELEGGITATTSLSAPLSMIPTGTLVSFVGMVQDVSDSALLAASNSNAFFTSWAGSEEVGSVGGEAEEFVQSPLLNVHQCYVIPIPGSLYGQHQHAPSDANIHPPATTNGVPSSPTRPRRTRAEDDDGRDDVAVVAGGRRMDTQPIQIEKAEAEGGSEEDDDDAEDELLVIEGEDEAEEAPQPPQQSKGTAKLLPSDHNHSGDGGGGLLNLPTAPPATSLSLGAIVTLITPPAGSGSGGDGGEGEDTSMECHPVRPNSIVECYGIIMEGGGDPSSSSMAEEEDEFMASPRYDRIPASLARRVLCIGCRVITDVSELVSRPFSFKPTTTITTTATATTNKEDIHQVAWSVFSSRVLERGTRMALRRQLFTVFIPRVRGVLLHYLRHTVCGGDELAAEYLLIHLCSTTDTRQNANTVPVGDVPLRLLLPVQEGISNRVRDEVAGEVACHLADMLRPIITCGTSSVNITRGVVAQQRSEEDEACNSRRVAPKAPSLMPNKDAEGCYIAAAPFQLPHGHSTILAISAHSSEGAGGSAVSGALPSAVQEEAYMFVHRQCVTIDYFFNKVELGTDIRALVVQPLMGGLQDAAATDRIHTSPPFRLACTVVLSPTPAPTLPAAVPTSEGVPRPFSKLSLLRTAQPGDAEEGSNASVVSAAADGSSSTTNSNIPSTWSSEDSASCRLYFDIIRRCASSDLTQMSLGINEEDLDTTTPADYTNLRNEFTAALESHSVELNTELVRWQTRCRSAFNSDSLIHNNSLSVVLSMARALARSHGRLPLGSVSFSSLQPSPRNSRLLELTMAGGAEYGWVTSPQESLDDFHHIQRLEASRFQRNLRHKYTPSEGCA